MAARNAALAQQERAAYLFLSPWLIGLFCLTLGPTLVSLYLSFTSFDLLQPPRWIGLENYALVWADADFWNATRNTVLITVITVPGALVVGLALGMIAAAVAVAPALFSASAQLPYASLAITLAAVLVNGALWTWAATRAALRGDLLAALRNE